jgi:sodium/proline symporter
MTATTSVFGVYLLILFGLAIWSRKETTSLSGYFLAGKKLPPWVVAFSTNATGESGWLLLGLTGMGYAVGAQAFWVVAGEMIGISCAWLLISRKLKRKADQCDAITVPDVLADHFNDSRHVLRGISVLIIVIMVGAYVAAQMVATGKAFSGFTDMTYTTSVVFGASIIIAYTLVGGYKAVAYTDLLQGVLMLLGLIIVPLVAIDAAGGWQAMIEILRQDDPTLLSFWGPPGESLEGWVVIISFLAIGIPFIGVPQLLVRFMSARSEQSLVPAGIISIAVILCFDIGAVTAGMAGRALFPGIEDPEGILPLLSTELFPPLIAGVLLVVVVAAIMSTVDSLLLLASSAVVRDFLQKIKKIDRSDHTLANYGKAITLVVGLLGVAFALKQSPLVFWFVLFAWSGLGAAFGPVVLCMLFYPKTTLNGAIAGMVGGFLTSIIWIVFFKEGAYGLYEIIPGFIVGLTLIFSVSKFESRE